MPEGARAVKSVAYAIAGFALVVYGTVVILDTLKRARIINA